MEPGHKHCPFCKNDLDVGWKDKPLSNFWHCRFCRCITDDSMTRYAVLKGTYCGTWTQEFCIDNIYIITDFGSKITKIHLLEGCVIQQTVSIPFKFFDLFTQTEEEVLSKLRVYLTFS